MQRPIEDMEALDQENKNLAGTVRDLELCLAAAGEKKQEASFLEEVATFAIILFMAGLFAGGIFAVVTWWDDATRPIDCYRVVKPPMPYEGWKLQPHRRWGSDPSAKSFDTYPQLSHFISEYGLTLCDAAQTFAGDTLDYARPFTTYPITATDQVSIDTITTPVGKILVGGSTPTPSWR